ncbi:winged helix-turn-helix domain-containing protein [Streptomyces sp. AD16]|nr:winged helix-turn-helix domain-containing protein [Streptomyces albus]WDV34154.1 winged helix-turn-helix domain-containing protein [Streptomyces sp. AD16]
MKFNVLGSVGIEVEGHFRSIRGGHQRVLLAVLLVNGGQLVPAEDLYGELWGEQPPVTVENALQAHVSRLRRTLQECGDHAPALITRSTGYSLEFPAQDLDMNAFRQGVGRARSLMAKDRDAAAALLTQSLGLWRGAPSRTSPEGCCASRWPSSWPRSTWPPPRTNSGSTWSGRYPPPWES